MGNHIGFHPDDGSAMPITIFLAIAIVVLMAAVGSRAFAESDNTAADSEWEQALHVADAGIDLFINQLLTVPEADLGTGQEAADLETKSDMVAAAEKMIEEDPSVIVPAPDGEIVLVKPDDAAEVFAVAAVPAWDDPGRKTRVLQAGYERQDLPAGLWTGEHAVLTGGDLDISGSARVVGAGPHVHANGSLGFGATLRVEGCGTESVDSGYIEPDSGCPASPAPTKPVPVIDARQMHHLADWDLCPDGAHYGPNHPSYSYTGDPTDDASVCWGSVVVAPAGWTGSRGSWSVNGKVDGVFYVYGGDVTGKPGQTTGNPADRGPAPATIVVERHYGADESPDACPLEGRGGSVHLAAQSMLNAHPSTGAAPGIAIVAEGEVFLNGGAEIQGLVLVRAGFRETGTSEIDGAVVVIHPCHETATLNGDIILRYVGPVTTPFHAVIPGGGDPVVIRRTEH